MNQNLFQMNWPNFLQLSPEVSGIKFMESGMHENNIFLDTKHKTD